MVGLLICSFILYPIFLKLVSSILPEKKQEIVESERIWPKVTFTISAYNEEKVIAEKIQNSLNLDYPKNLLEIMVLSDDSSDKTDEIVESFSEQGVILISIKGRLGKTNGQNVGVERAQGEIVVFSDANTMYSANAIKKLVKSYDNPKVGVVIGKRVYTETQHEANKEGLYERLENLMKDGESKLGGTIGANGAIYSVKKEYYIALDSRLMSDITEPLMVATQSNKKTILCNEAIGSELVDNDYFQELKRKRRIVLRAMNSMWKIKFHLFKSPSLLIKLFFHKFVRWYTFHLVLLAMISGILSKNCLGYLIFSIFAMYIITSLASIFYLKKSEKEITNKILNLCIYSFGMFYSSFLASVDFLRGKEMVSWTSRQ